MAPLKTTTLDPISVADALGGKASGNQISAPAPGHSKHDRSLSVKLDPNAPDGFVVKAHAGEDPLEMRDYVRRKLGLGEWQPGQHETATVVTFRPKEAPKPFSDAHLLRGGYHVAATYPYTSMDGEVMFEVIRYEHPARPKTFLQRHERDGRQWSGRPAEPMLYRAHELAQAPDAHAYLVEGEKDADNLADLGLLATTVPNGAWPEDLSLLHGRTVYVLADNDEPGAQKADKAMEKLSGVATALAIDLPDLPPKGDVTDWLDAGGTVEQLEALAQAAKPPTRRHDPKRPVIGNARALQGMTFPDIKYVVPGYITEGATLLAGRPKLGKSWLVLEAGLAVATGGTCLGGVQCERGDVLYLALEDNQRRLHSRIRKMMPALVSKPWPERFHYSTEWPRQSDGGIKYLDEWCDDHPDARLVIVDVLAMFRPMQNGKANAYEQDFHAIAALKEFSYRRNVAVVIVTHTKKGASESGDPFELVSGTLGLSGAADTTLVLDRSGQGATLYGRGRDIPEIESAVEFDKTTCKWRVLGEAMEVRRSDERSQIIDALREAGEPLGPKDIARAVGKAEASVRYLLGQMVKADEIKKVGRGKYECEGLCEPPHNDNDPKADCEGLTSKHPSQPLHPHNHHKTPLNSMIYGSKECEDNETPPLTNIIPTPHNDNECEFVRDVRGVRV